MSCNIWERETSYWLISGSIAIVNIITIKIVICFPKSNVWISVQMEFLFSQRDIDLFYRVSVYAWITNCTRRVVRQVVNEFRYILHYCDSITVLHENLNISTIMLLSWYHAYHYTIIPYYFIIMIWQTIYKLRFDIFEISVEYFRRRRPPIFGKPSKKGMNFYTEKTDDYQNTYTKPLKVKKSLIEKLLIWYKE